MAGRKGSKKGKHFCMTTYGHGKLVPSTPEMTAARMISTPNRSSKGEGGHLGGGKIKKAYIPLTNGPYEGGDVPMLQFIVLTWHVYVMHGSKKSRSVKVHLLFIWDLAIGRGNLPGNIALLGLTNSFYNKTSSMLY